MCRRKSRPSPRPSDAPGISPGTSAMVNTCSPARDHAELRHQRGERVVGDLRPGRGQRRDQRRLAGRREADQPDVGHRAQLQHQVAGLARLAEQREPGRLAGRGGQRGVAQPAAAAGGGHEPGARRRPGRRRSRRRRSNTTVPSGTRSSRSSALAPALNPPWPCLPLRAVACGRWWKSSSVCTPGSTTSTTDAAAAAVAAVRAAERLELLPVHRGAAVAARPRGGVHHHAVDELGHRLLLTRRTAGHPEGGPPSSESAG